MEPQKGKLIVIEGTDGSGKATQVKLLFDRLSNAGFRCATLSFPQYEHKSSGPIAEYLNGKYGDPEKVNPYAASLFYAADRFDASFEIRRLLADGRVVVLDRYVDSNAGHQGGKIKDADARAKFLEWLYKTEYELLGVPKPDATLILHVPAEIGQQLVAKKQERLYIEGGKTRDGHEDNLGHLKDAEASYLWLAEKYPNEHTVISCIKNGALMTPEDIHQKVWESLASIIGTNAGKNVTTPKEVA